MTRSDCEKLIYSRMKEIIDIYRTYNPNGDYLSMSHSNGFFQCNNEHWEGGVDENMPIDFLINTREEEDE